LADTIEESVEELDERRTLLTDCLQKMGARQRGILQMKYVQRMISREIAEKIGRSVPSVDVMLMRLRRVLRECIESRMAEVSRIS